MALSLCTQIKDRNEFIQQAYPTWLKHPFEEIVVLDWNSKEPLLPFLLSFGDRRLKYLSLSEEKPYNLSKAKNLCIRALKGDIIYVDCDITLNEDFPGRMILESDVFYQEDSVPFTHIFGSCIFTKNQFDAVNGYNERLQGYGYEDADFFRRLQRAGFTKKPMVPGLEHIWHGDSIRCKHFDEKDLDFSTLRNRITAVGSIWGSLDTQESFDVLCYSHESNKLESLTI